MGIIPEHHSVIPRHRPQESCLGAVNGAASTRHRRVAAYVGAVPSCTCRLPCRHPIRSHSQYSRGHGLSLVITIKIDSHN